ncbi:shikimate dehydrogenase [Bacillus thermotolerans]|uniref:Shikimate dehydrogenase (NADP(+)) n=1 Tax=Bacillus thermotolerans TaxID=1221996 RepID=A0A0F5HTN1_BACTR|nr:shikimate dehydrogenase [Bacillus thermotolerans]KKB36395.1 Shikimate 5-dehydrogenase I alpha [Bacillus thermotolerans]KKB43170.1 Shikimate 5-dehydrogenase I alpha [Bacillus thermotolerans]KKB43573.1 Shikimate 5-dehydrogenase I alpha [Bacillus thermotolerans]
MKKLFGVIGDPIAQSMSPVMHNDAFERVGIDAYYHPFHVQPAHLSAAVQGMKAIGVNGFNVTIPHKAAIIPLLDRVDPLAKSIGAVNTVVWENDGWTGYNTDGSGFVRGLQEEYGTSLEGKNMLVIGAGGAARAIYYTLAFEGAGRIDIANRTVEKGLELLNGCPVPVEGAAFSVAEAAEQLEVYDIIVQTTSIGMVPLTDESPLPVDRLKQGTFLSDIIYNPLETKIMREAKLRGARVQSGLKMFVYQGALAFEKWTGLTPDTKRMEEVVLNQLEEKNVNN